MANILSQGNFGEQLARHFAKKKNLRPFQPDWIVTDNNGNYTFLEVKTKSMFEKPPFDAQGLDLRQVYMYEQARNDLGIRTLIIIVELPDKRKNPNWMHVEEIPVRYQYLDVLEQGKKFTTKTGKIRLYPLESFDRDKELEKWVYNHKEEVLHGIIN